MILQLLDLNNLKIRLVSWVSFYFSFLIDLWIHKRFFKNKAFTDNLSSTGLDLKTVRVVLIMTIIESASC